MKLLLLAGLILSLGGVLLILEIREMEDVGPDPLEGLRQRLVEARAALPAETEEAGREEDGRQQKEQDLAPVFAHIEELHDKLDDIPSQDECLRGATPGLTARWDLEHRGDLRKALASRAFFFEAIDQILSRPDVQQAIEGGRHGIAGTTLLLQCRDLTCLLASRAVVDAGDGGSAQASHWLETAGRLFALVDDDSLIAYHFGSKTDDMILQAAGTILQQNGVLDPELRRVVLELSDTGRIRQRFAETLRAEFARIDGIIRGDSRLALRGAPATERPYTTLEKRQVLATVEPQLTMLADDVAWVSAPDAQLLSKEPRSSMYVAFVEHVRRARLARVALALDAWRKEHGGFPQTLDVLLQGDDGSLLPASLFSLRRTERGWTLTLTCWLGQEREGDPRPGPWAWTWPG